MMTYKLDDNGNIERVDELSAWALWITDRDTQRKLIICRDDVYDCKRRFLFTLITRFRGQSGPLDDPGRPLVWVTEGTDGSFYGATPTMQEAKNNHERQLRVLKSIHKRK